MFMEDQTVIEDDISASIDFNLSPSFQVPHDHHQYYNNNQEVPFSQAAAEGPLYAPMPPPLPAAYNIRLRSNNSAACTLADPVIGPYLSSNCNMNNAPFTFDNSWLFTGGTTTGLSFDQQEMESQGDNGGFFMPDSLARVFNCSTGDLQTLSSEGQHLLSGSPGTTLASEISSLEDPTFKVGKISAEERRRKINRYLKKRNERNFSKKIKYACRKTLADSRPRVRGRFAKNDELGELARSGSTGHEDDVDDDVRLTFSNHIPDHHHKVVKEEGSMSAIDSILANITGVKYPIQSWI
ncbi:hypothetical protein ACS0TY_022946 [Phlomoides rotata]